MKLKRIICMMLCVMLLGSLALPVWADGGAEIIAQPQNPTYNAGAVAIYSVTAKGENLTCGWYINYEGTEYELTHLDDVVDPWENYAGEQYGMTSSKEGGNTTFNFVFQGIGSELDGCTIYAVVHDGYKPVRSERAYISIAEGAKTPPATKVPASVELWLGDVYDLECIAEDYDGTKLSYMWYSTATGKLQDIVALGRGSETESTLHLVAAELGTTYYVCMVTTESGGSAYTSIIPVTVVEAKYPAEEPRHVCDKERLCVKCGDCCVMCTDTCPDCRTCANCAKLCSKCYRCTNCVDICAACGKCGLCCLCDYSGIKITAQPQNPAYNDGAVAIYAVSAKGKNLSCRWYILYNAIEYELTRIDEVADPWEGYAGAQYGMSSSQNGDETTFNYIFEGIGSGLDGSMIYAVIYDGHQPVTSDKAYISVVEGAKTPPSTKVLPELRIAKSKGYNLTCIAESPDGSKLSYLWYSASTGDLQGITAINRGSETEESLRIDTSVIGTTYYCCMVTTANGGSAYTSLIPVTVFDPSDPSEKCFICGSSGVTFCPECGFCTANCCTCRSFSSEPETTEAPETSTTTEVDPVTEKLPEEDTDEKTTGTPTWAVVTIAGGAMSAGVGLAVLVMKKKR